METERLILRKMSLEDAKDFFELNNDPEVLKYTGDDPFASIDAARDFLAQYKDYDKNGYGRLSVILKETGENIGWCGLKYHPEEDETDLGCRLKKKFWNKGYATEASKFCIQYGFESLQLPLIVGRVMKGNTASIKVLENVGMKFWKEHEFHKHPGLYYIIKKEEYFNQLS